MWSRLNFVRDGAIFIRTVGGLLRAQDEPLFGLDCQESARDLFPVFLALLTRFLVGPEGVCLGGLRSVN